MDIAAACNKKANEKLDIRDFIKHCTQVESISDNTELYTDQTINEMVDELTYVLSAFEKLGLIDAEIVHQSTDRIRLPYSIKKANLSSIGLKFSRKSKLRRITFFLRRLFSTKVVNLWRKARVPLSVASAIWAAIKFGVEAPTIVATVSALAAAIVAATLLSQ